MKNVITIDIESMSDNNGKYDVWIADEGGSGAHYQNIDAQTVGDYTADLIDCLEEADSGESYLKNTSKYMLIASDGTSMDHTIYPDYDTAYDAMKKSLKHSVNPSFDIKSAENSFMNDTSMYLSAIDNGVNLEKDWIYEIIKL